MEPDPKLHAQTRRDSRSGADRREMPRIPLSIGGEVVLAGDITLPCSIHDVSESGVGITVDPQVAAKRGHRRLSVRCGDPVTLCFTPPGEIQVMLESSRIRRVWCRDGTVEMGLRLGQVSPDALEKLAIAGSTDGRKPLDRRRRMTPRNLDGLLRRVAEDTFPRIAERVEQVAGRFDPTETGKIFHALIRIEASKQDIAERFVALARPQLMPELSDGSSVDALQPLHFDHAQFAEAFAMACSLTDRDAAVRGVIEELVVARAVRDLAPPLAATLP